MLMHVTGENCQKEVLDSETPVVVDFWAEWCPPCKFLGPILEKVAPDYEGRVKFCKLDVDAAGELARRYGVMAIPTLIVFVGGEEKTRHEGAMPEAAFRQWVDADVLG